MKFTFAIILVFMVCNTIAHYKEAVPFIKDFFQNKNTTITMNVCWEKHVIKDFLKEIMIGNKWMQISFYRDSTDFVRHKSNNNYYVFDLIKCEQSWVFLNQINQSNQFITSTKFLLLTDNLYQLSSNLANYTIYPSSELVVASLNGTTFKLSQPYRVDKTSPIIWEDYGVWTKNDGLIENYSNKPTSQRRYNLKQANMNVVFVVTDNDTWNHLDDFRFPRVDSFTKQIFGAIRSLLDYCDINATYTGTEYFGYYDNDTGLWNGIIDHINRSKAEISGSAPYFTHIRAQAVDFIKMQNPTDMRFILKKPPLSYVKNVFELAFEVNVWLCMGVVLLIFAIALIIVLNVETKQKQINHKNNFTVSDVILILLEALCQQGTTTDPKEMSGRILALILFMAFMFIYVAYSANIIVMLQSQIEIKTVNELLDSHMDAGGLDNNYMRRYMTESKDPVRQQLYKKKIGPTGFYSLEKGMHKVHEGFFAFHVELGSAFDYVLEKFTDYDMCSLQELEGYIQQIEAYTCVPKNSPYKEIFKVGLMKIDEYGIQQRNYIRHFIKPKCYSKGSSFESVGIVETYQCFFILFYGILLSIALCFVEKLTQYMHNRKYNK